jgi:phosphatidylglycerophosphate synthase
MFARAIAIHQKTGKPRDIVWNRWVARPIASLMLVGIERTRLSPNQATLLSLLLFAASGVTLALDLTTRGLVLGMVLLQSSYVFDCVDGQLARLRSASSPVGAHLDYLADELKALTLITATSLRLFQTDPQWPWLVEGILGVLLTAFGLTLTTFVRRPVYRAATGANVDLGAGDYGDGLPTAAPTPRPLPIRLIESAGHFIIHYPSHITLFAIANRMDWFLHAYLAVNAAHAGRTLLGVFLRLGRKSLPRDTP